MSRKKSTHLSIYDQRRASHREPISMQELKNRWNSLRLHPETKVHLEYILEVEGVELAFAATTALILELEHEEQHVARSLWGWVIEELRLLFLEEGCQHLLESGRLIIDSLLASSLMHVSVLVIPLALPLLVLGVFSIFLCLLSILQHQRASEREQ